MRANGGKVSTEAVMVSIKKEVVVVAVKGQEEADRLEEPSQDLGSNSSDRFHRNILRWNRKNDSDPLSYVLCLYFLLVLIFVLGLFLVPYDNCLGLVLCLSLYLRLVVIFFSNFRSLVCVFYNHTCTASASMSQLKH